MIPIKLQIKNFLSYGSDSQIIDFEPYNLICLSGKNGHGKSALLDAITWSIWGEARKSLGIGKPDQGLLRLGQRQMMVIFDFEFNKNKYRVRREFTFAYGKAYAYLEFGIFDGEDKITSLTDKTIRATQAKIESMIGLNYDSFSNSAFLRQGNSNEFSRKSAKERKEILCTILGLDKYESLRKLAMDKIKKLSQEKESILKLCEHIEKDLSLYEDVKISFLNIKEELNKILVTENEYKAVKENIEKEKSAFLLKDQQYKLLNLQLVKIKEDKENKIAQIKKIYSLWKESHKKRIALANPKELEQQKAALSKKIEECQKSLKYKLEYKEELLKYKEQEQILLKQLSDKFDKDIQEKKLNLERSLVYKINLNEKIAVCDRDNKVLAFDLKKVNDDLVAGNKDFKEFDLELLNKLEKQFEKRKNFYQELIAQGNWIKSEVKALEQKKKLSFDEANPSCPLCEQNLSASRKKFLKQQFVKQENFYQHRLTRISNLIVTLKEVLIKQNEAIKLQKQTIENNKFIKLKIDDLTNQNSKLNIQINELNLNKLKLVQDLQELEKSIVDQNNQIDTLINQSKISIETNDIFIKLREAIDSLDNKLNKITYDQDEHSKIAAQLDKIDLMLADYANFMDLLLLQDSRKNEISQTALTVKAVNIEIMNFEEKLKEYEDLKAIEKAIFDNEQQYLNSLKELSKNKELLLNQHGSLNNQKSKLEQLVVEHKNQKKLVSQLEESIDEYKQISNALSKDGIQALLIEDSIPEIEYEANQLLAKLTDNQAQIFIESLRDLKKGGAKETLDIKVSDGAGIRPYEMFSGGEAFRIDFALRIAISKLLARRAGTSLQTLIIDEGFGSQDEEGLVNIMDSLYKIQEDFAKIIIVSHLPSMKDQFPVHFFVEKGPAGSRVKIIEQG